MLISTYEPLSRKDSRNIKFRGKSAYYWKQKILGLEHSHEPEKGFDKEVPDVIIVFEPRKFWITPKSGVRQFIGSLTPLNPDEKWVAYIKGTPFAAFSREAYKAIAPDLEAGEKIFACLQAPNSWLKTHQIEIDNDFRVVDPTSEFIEVEDAIVRFQLSTYTTSGVLFDDYRNFYIEGLPPVGTGTRIGTGSTITGDSRVGTNAVLYPNVFIENSTVGNNCILLPGCVVRDSELEAMVQIGPYTHLRNGALVKEGAKMGNFVEMKKSVLGEGSKAMHLTYIGDAEVGKKVNIGAGTITCNYDGVNKNKTILEDGVFIGSGTELVAPVTIRKNGYVAAGSTITEEVPEDSLGVARGRQRIINGWVARKRRKVCKP